MQLGHYLKDREISLDDFARRVGAANRSVVHKWITGCRVPRRSAMAAIVRETGGQVQPADFFDIEAAE